MFAEPLIERLIEGLLHGHGKIVRERFGECKLPLEQRVRLLLQGHDGDRRNAFLDRIDKKLQRFINGPQLRFVSHRVDDRQKKTGERRDKLEGGSIEQLPQCAASRPLVAGHDTAGAAQRYREPEKGEQQARADQKVGQNRLVARVETDFLRAEEPEVEPLFRPRRRLQRPAGIFRDDQRVGKIAPAHPQNRDGEQPRPDVLIAFPKIERTGCLRYCARALLQRVPKLFGRSKQDVRGCDRPEDQEQNDDRDRRPV